MEMKAAVDSGVCVVAKKAGTIERSTSKTIVMKNDDGSKDEYHLTKFARSNQSNCYNQRPIVFKGDHVQAGDVIADGPSTQNGEIALGKNPLIGFMTWEGYNYEDAVLLSERLVMEDVYTSVHIEEYEAEARDTKLGPEEITRDVPGVGDDALKDLDVPLAGKDILIVEDILDSGLTLSYIKELLESRGPRSIRIATLLDKPSRRKVDLQADYIGFSVPDEFVIGYGLDYDEKYRNLPYIGILKPEVYSV